MLDSDRLGAGVRKEGGNKGASGVVVSHHGCSAGGERTLPSPARLPAGGSLGKKAEGFSRDSDPAAPFHNNEEVVSISELMGVTSEAPERIPTASAPETESAALQWKADFTAFTPTSQT